MKNSIAILLIGLLLTSCQPEKNDSPGSSRISENNAETDIAKKGTSNTQEIKEYLTESQIDSLTGNYDRLMDEKVLTKYSYPNMSGCGGGLFGYYQDSVLLIIDATFKAELGFSHRRVYWTDNNIVKIVYREHFAEWNKYQKKYPADIYEWDTSKMTYSDTVYEIKLGQMYQMKKIAEEKVLNEKLDSAMIRRLVECGFDMKKELETEKKLEN